METEKLESLLIDYIDGKLTDAEKSAIENELTQNKSSLQLYEQLKQVMNEIDRSPTLEPSSTMRLDFEKALQQEINGAKKQKQIFFQPVVLRIAAGFILVMAGVGIGYWINKNNVQQQEIARLRHEMDSTKRMMMAMMTNTQSASQRMLGVAASYQLQNADDEIVTALLSTMNEDANTNVRLAALEALSKFHHQEHVRKALIQSLAKQKDPLVQISLIRLMVEMKEKSVIQELERITKDKELIKAVKDEAYAGLLKLS
jgi:anti-sigma factor RsiW